MNQRVRNTSEYKKISTEESLRILETPKDGLSESDAGKRLETFGYNEIAEKKKNPARRKRLHAGPLFWSPA